MEGKPRDNRRFANRRLAERPSSSATTAIHELAPRSEGSLPVEEARDPAIFRAAMPNGPLTQLWDMALRWKEFGVRRSN